MDNTVELALRAALDQRDAEIAALRTQVAELETGLGLLHASWTVLERVQCGQRWLWLCLLVTEAQMQALRRRATQVEQSAAELAAELRQLAARYDAHLDQESSDT